MRVIVFSLLVLITSVLSTASAQTPPPQSTQQDEEQVKLSADVSRLYNEGKYDEALPLAKRLLLMREKAAGKDSLIVANALNTIGSLYLKKEKYYDAASYFERSLKITETVQGGDTLGVASILDRLALTSYVKGDYSKTEERYQRALAIREKLLGAAHSEVLSSLSRLADYYQSTQQYKKAEMHLQRIITVKESAAGTSGSALAETIYQYACLKRKMNEPREAEKMEARAEGLLDTSGVGVPTVFPTELGVVNGRALKLPKPSYPEEARVVRQTGLVHVRVLINEAGKVIRACAIKGPSVFWRVTEGAAYRAIFTPTTIDGQAVKVTGFITYNFVAN
jgi:tetratricopeptide (TPR) repeat protein